MWMLQFQLHMIECDDSTVCLLSANECFIFKAGTRLGVPVIKCLECAKETNCCHVKKLREHLNIEGGEVAAVFEAYESKPLHAQKKYMVHCKSELKIPFDEGHKTVDITKPLRSSATVCCEGSTLIEKEEEVIIYDEKSSSKCKGKVFFVMHDIERHPYSYCKHCYH